MDPPTDSEGTLYSKEEHIISLFPITVSAAASHRKTSVTSGAS